MKAFFQIREELEKLKEAEDSRSPDVRRDGIKQAPKVHNSLAKKHDRMNKMGHAHDKPKVNEISSNALSNYMQKSTVSAGKPRQDTRTMDKRIGGQKMADDKLRKMQGKGSAAKVAATKEANTCVGQRDQMKITGVAD